MERTRGLHSAALAAVWFLCSLDAAALTLGRARGPVLLGKPLQVSIPVVLDNNEDPCAEADLFQGDVRSGALEVTLERTEGSPTLRVRSTTVIREPVVTIYLRVGCNQQYSRSYVLLADHAQEPADAPLVLAPSTMLGTSQPAAPTPTAASSGWLSVPEEPVALASATTLRSAPASPRQQREGVRSSGSKTRVVEGKVTTKVAKPRAAPASDRKEEAATPLQLKTAEVPAKTSEPRLKLEAIDFEVEAAPPLKLSPQLTVNTATPGERADAAAAWKALGAPVEQVAAQLQRNEAVEAEVKALREAMQRHTAGMAQLAEQLEKVRAERDLASSVLFGGAGALGLGLVFMLWMRSRALAQEQSRWRQLAQGSASPLGPAMPEAHGGSPRRGTPPFTPDIDSDWAGMEDSVLPNEPAAGQLAQNRPRPAGLGPLPEFTESQVAGAQLPKAEELLDIKQKAEFFLAIGEEQRAMDLLEAQIHEHLGSSPLVWLDLLDIYQRFKRREDYERLRGEFQVAFNARLPDFETNRKDSGGIEGHPRALSRIVLLWPSPRVLKVIEDSLFENPHLPGSIPFDLQASRDLLLLYGIAKEVVQQQEEEAEAAELALLRMRQAEAYEATEHSPLSVPPVPTEPVPLASLDDEPVVHSMSIGPDVDLNFLDLGKPDVQAEPGRPPEDFDFDFEPKPRKAAIP